MLTKIVWQLLRQYLTPFIKNFKPKQDLKINLWKGSIQFVNVDLKTECMLFSF